MPQPRNKPYIWVTWLSKLLVGDSSCEWAVWFKAHYTRYQKMPNDFDMPTWQMRHTAMLGDLRDKLSGNGRRLFLERQNKFALDGRSATLGGTADLVAAGDTTATVYDTKTGAPNDAHRVQVMLYMYALPRAKPEFEGVTFDGMVVYEDHEIVIPASAIDDEFVGMMARQILRVSDKKAAPKIPSATECAFCEITASDCPERIEDEVFQESMTTDF